MFSLKRNDERFVRAILNPDYRSNLLPRLEQGRTCLLYLFLIMAVVSVARPVTSTVVALLVALAVFLVSDLSLKMFKLFDAINPPVPEHMKMTPELVVKDLKEQKRESLVAALITFAITVVLLRLIR